MNLLLFFNSDFFAWIALPLFIFIARVLDVTLGTIRVIFIARGFKYYAPIIGFFEIMIWLSAISQIIQNINNLYLFFAYSGGFAAGTFVGIYLEEKISLGTVLIQAITRKNSLGIITELRAKNFKTTVIEAEGSNGNVKMILVVTKRQNIHKVIEIIKSFNKNAFYAIEDVRTVNEGVHASHRNFFDYLKPFTPFKKAK
ncbi:MAG: DUF2179 domain-containing protein [archaeon]